MTTKQAKLVKGIAEGDSPLQAGRKAGYAFPEVESYRALDSARVQTALNTLMDKQGLSERTLLKPIKDSLDATKITPLGESPDHYARLKGSELAWKLRGRLKTTPDQAPAGPTQINIVHNYRANGTDH